MSFASNIQGLATRIATEVKALRTLINGNATDLTGLTTTSKTHLVSAINEVKGIADAAMLEGGGADVLDELTDVAITTPVAGHVLRHDGTQFVNVLGTTHFDAAGAAAAAQSASQPLDTDLTAIAALTTTTYGRAFLSLANQAALTALLPAGTETAMGLAELATQVETNAGTADDRVITPLKLQTRLAAFAQPLDSDLTSIAALTTTAFGRALLTIADSAGLAGQVRVASEASTGVVELATAAETTTGTDNTRAVHPQGLKVELDKKANTSSLSAVATSGNAADLTGTLNTAQLPALAINETFSVATQAAMLALTAQRGDMAIRTDLGKMFVLTADAPATLANWTQLTATGDVVSVAGRTGTVVLAKGDVGLGNVDNTADSAKPVSTAQQTALDLKAPLASPTFTGTVSGVTKAHVGLGNVDNTSDANKPVSTAQQTALNLKANLAAPALTGSPTVDGLAIVKTDDARLSNARTPTAHTHVLTDLPDAWVKRSVRVASTVNVALPPGGTTLTIDGVAAANGDRVLLKNQTAPAQNGIYDVSGVGASVVLTRSADADAASELAGATVNVDQGTQAGSTFTTTLASTATIGTTAVNWYTVLTSQTSYALSTHLHTGTYEPVLAAGTAAQYYRGDKTWQTLDKAAVGLANVDNTSDANKPVSTATTTALALKAPIASPTFTGTVGGITKSMVGLPNVDNTADTAKPVSTAQQTALDGKQPLDTDLTAIAALVSAANKLPYATGAGTWAMADLSVFGRSLIDDADAATARATLAVYSTTEIGDPNTDFVATFNAGLV